MSKFITMLIAVGLLLACQPAQALTRKQVLAITEALSVTSGAIAYLIAAPGAFFPKDGSMVVNKREGPVDLGNGTFAWEPTATIITIPGKSKFECPCSSEAPYVKRGHRLPLCAGLAAFAGANLLFGWILSKYTPTARYEWARELLADFDHRYLFNQIITNENLSHILQKSGCQANELPLVSLFLELQYFDRRLVYVTSELARSIKDDGYSSLSKKMNEIIAKANEHLERIRANEAVVQSQSQWLEQWKIHQHRVLEREKMAHQAMQTHVVWHM